jgi:hypothetical protein
LFSLFFAGNNLAPDLYADQIPIQDFLQEHYLEAMRTCWETVKDLPAVVGMGSMNEPSEGLIGKQHLDSLKEHENKAGPCPTMLQSFALADGKSFEVPVFKLTLGGFKKTGSNCIKY